jgi:hypothetical protein
MYVVGRQPAVAAPRTLLGKVPESLLPQPGHDDPSKTAVKNRLCSGGQLTKFRKNKKAAPVVYSQLVFFSSYM